MFSYGFLLIDNRVHREIFVKPRRDDDDTGALKREGIVHVLLVEDNPGDIKLTEQAFADCRDTVRLHVVRDGVEAMDYLYRRGKHAAAPPASFVLLDLNLPRKDGREVLAEIKAHPLLRRIPDAILTTSQAEEDVLRTYDLHANCYLTKPVDFEKFLKMMKSLESFWFNAVGLPVP